MSEQAQNHHVFLTVPNSGSIMPCALTGVAESTRAHRMSLCPMQFGDIPHNFNMLWCQALMSREQMGLTHFAMLHTDIRPGFMWLDTLLEEMDRVNADVMSAIVPIKDGRGLTTTGIRYPGVWGTRRFTMKEIYRLPETFSVADTDEPDQILAINTGCWVCRLPAGGWPERFPGFQNEHRIVWRGGEPCPDFDSEDWLFSDWAASQGLRVFATRKVYAAHRGAWDYPNEGVWGTWETELQRPTRPLAVAIPDPHITVETYHPIALDSLDHVDPLGARMDNTSSLAFNRKLFAVVPNARVLDLGCSGGGFVRSILEGGGLAVGLEGSDYSLKRARAEWGTIPNHLFTADITKPFAIRNGSGPDLLKFNTFTAWEVLEHLAEEDIPQVLANIRSHTVPNATLICSVSASIEPHHRTARSKDWWVDLLSTHGFIHSPELEQYFNPDTVRGGFSEHDISRVICMTIPF